MTPDILSLFLNAGTVGIFMAYVLYQSEKDRKERKERMETDAKERKERDEAWRLFLKDQDEAMCKSLEIVAGAVGKLTDDFQAHDQVVRSNLAIWLDSRKTTPRAK